MKNKLLITGGTGTIGRALIAELQASKANFVVGSRDFEKAASVLGIEKHEWVNFDFQKPETYAEATNQVDRVFLLGPPLTFHLDQVLKPFVDFLEKEHIRRIVYLSALGNESLKNELAFHEIMQDYIKEKQFDYTILQPSFFAQNFKNYEYDNLTKYGITYVVAGDGKVGFVDAVDVAKVAAKVLTENGHSGKTYQLTGPELLDFHMAAVVLTKVLGKTIVYPNPSEADFRKTLSDAGVPSFIADYMIPVYGMIKNGMVGYVTSDIEKVLGRKPTTLEQVLRRDFGK